MEDWYYKNQPIKCIEDMEKFSPGAFGFVYQLTVCDKRSGEPLYFYIGKKNIYSTTSKTATQKQLKEFPKSYFRRKKMKDGSLKYYLKNTNESNWKEYHSSNDFIKNNLNNFAVKREILIFAKSDSELSWLEAKEIICSDSLYDKKYLNNNVQIKRIIKREI